MQMCAKVILKQNIFFFLFYLFKIPNLKLASRRFAFSAAPLPKKKKKTRTHPTAPISCDIAEPFSGE